MQDDDLDLELEPAPLKPQAAPKAEPKPARPAPAAPKPSAAPEKPAAPAPEAAATALSAKKPGRIGGLMAGATAPLQRVHWPALTVTSAAWGLLVLIVIVFLAENWAPVRVNVFHLWFVDLPKAASFIIDMIIGAVIVLVYQRWTGRHGTRDKTVPPESA